MHNNSEAIWFSSCIEISVYVMNNKFDLLEKYRVTFLFKRMNIISSKLFSYHDMNLYLIIYY